MRKMILKAEQVNGTTVRIEFFKIRFLMNLRLAGITLVGCENKQYQLKTDSIELVMFLTIM